MTALEIANLYTRDIDKIIKELEAYKSEANIWVVKNEILNSSGTLIVHLIGSLSHFIGAALGSSGYIRNRESEFIGNPEEKRKLLSNLHETKSLVMSILNNLSEEELAKDYIHEIAGKHSTEYYLVFFAMHLNYHLGQINYHRRLVDL